MSHLHKFPTSTSLEHSIDFENHYLYNTQHQREKLPCKYSESKFLRLRGSFSKLNYHLIVNKFQVQFTKN